MNGTDLSRRHGIFIGKRAVLRLRAGRVGRCGNHATKPEFQLLPFVCRFISRGPCQPAAALRVVQFYLLF